MSDTEAVDTSPSGSPPGWLRPLLAYQRGMDTVSNTVGSVSKYLVLAVVAVGFVNAVLRYVGRATSQQLTSNRFIELQWYLYASLFLLAFAYILQHGINVRVDFWFAEQSRKTKAIIDIIGHLVGLIPFCLLGMWLVWNPIMSSYGRRPDGTFPTNRVWEIWELSPDPGGLPRAPIKTMLMIGLVLLFLQAIAEMIKLVAELVGAGEHVERTAEFAPIRVE